MIWIGLSLSIVYTPCFLGNNKLNTTFYLVSGCSMSCAIFITVVINCRNVSSGSIFSLVVELSHILYSGKSLPEGDVVVLADHILKPSLTSFKLIMLFILGGSVSSGISFLRKS